jgi:hypothetical protein
MVELSSDARMGDIADIYGALSNGKIASELLRIDDQCFEKFGIRLLNPRSRLIVYIALKGSVTIKDALLNSDLSYRAFYVMQNRLRDQGLIDIHSDTEDRRMKHMKLGKSISVVKTGLA